MPLGPEPVLQRLGVECIDRHCPFTGQTTEGVRLGETRAQLIAAHGKPLAKVHNNWIVFYRQGLGAGFADKLGLGKDILQDDRIRSLQVLLPSDERL